MSNNEDTPPKWEDTQPVEDTPPKWEDTQPIEQESSLGVVGKYIPDFLNPLAMSEEERAKIKAQTPWQAVKHAAADAISTASMALPMPGAKGLLGFAARTGTAAATSGVDKALHNVADDKPVMGDVGTSALIGGGINAGIEAAIAAAVKGGGLAVKGGKWVMDQAAETMFGNKLTKEMLDNPLVQETISKVASLKGAMGLGKNLEGRVADVADEAKGAYTKAVGNISGEAIPISKVLPDETLRNLDVGSLDNDLRSKLPNIKKKLLSDLEPLSLKNSREEKLAAIYNAIKDKRALTSAEKQNWLDLQKGIEVQYTLDIKAAKEADTALKAQIKEIESQNKLQGKIKPSTDVQDYLKTELTGKGNDISGELASAKSEIEQYKNLYPEKPTAVIQEPTTDNPLMDSLKSELVITDQRISTILAEPSSRKTSGLKALQTRRDEIQKEINSYLKKKKLPKEKITSEVRISPEAARIKTMQDEYAVKEQLAKYEQAKLDNNYEADLPTAIQLDKEVSAFTPQPVPEFKSAVPEIQARKQQDMLEIENQIKNLERAYSQEASSIANTTAEIHPQTTLREAYTVANRPIRGDLNPFEDTLGANVRDLGGESVALADKAKGNMETLNTLSDASVRQDGSLKSAANNILRWGGRAAALTHPMAWATAEIASNPELRYVLGSGLEKLGKWSPKLQDAYNNGGAKAVNVLVNTLNQTDPEFRQAHAGNQQVSPYQEGAEKPQIKKPELSRDNFLKNLSGVESGGKYDATNPNSSATGKYQFLWKTWGDDISRWAGAPVSQKMFLSNPKLQDLYMKDHHDTTLMQGAKTLRNSSPNASKRSDTELKALIHFKGLEGARKYLDQGVDDTSANNIGVEDYLKRVGGG